MKSKNFNIPIPCDKVPVNINNNQKRVLEKMVLDLYTAIGDMLTYVDEDRIMKEIKNKAVERLQELYKVIREETKYILNVMYKGVVMVFDVELMIDTYGFNKDEIYKEIEDLDSDILDQIFGAKGTIVMPLFNASWVSTKKGNQIKVTSCWGIEGIEGV